MADKKIVDLRAVRDGAAEAPPPADDMPAGADDGGDGEREHSGRAGLHELCPVIPLGVRGKSCFYLDALGQQHELPWEKHSHNNIKGMFGSYNHLLEQIWPRKKSIQDDKTGGEVWIVTGWAPEKAAADLMAAASDLGVWNPEEKTRGRGAWRGPKGELILHCGDKIWKGPLPGASNRAGKWHEPGLIDGMVYPLGPAMQRPQSKPVPAAGARGKSGNPLNPGEVIIKDLQTWSLRRGHTDAHLMLGLAGSQMLGGCLPVRPVSWITAPYASGKTELVDCFSALLGPNGQVKVDNTTEAHIRQKLKYDSRPVLLDENGDPDDGADPRRVQAMLQLMRVAYSGGTFGRGGNNHEGVDFIARSSFLSASILMPSLMPQDRSRMLIIDLDRLRDGQEKPDTSEKRWHALGQAMLSRLVQQWHRYDETFSRYRDVLMRPVDKGGGGHRGRSADVFATLLACASLVLSDETPAADSDELRGWAAKLRQDQLAETAGGIDDEVECWQFLLASPIDMYRSGGKHLVSEWVSKAAAPASSMADHNDAAEAQRVLQTAGLRVIGWPELLKLYDARSQDGPWPEGMVKPTPPYLAVANQHPGLAQLFKDKRWARGVWAQSLKRLPGALAPPKPIWLAGSAAAQIKAGSARVTLVPLFDAAASGDAGPGGVQPPGTAGMAASNAPAGAAPGRAASEGSSFDPGPRDDNQNTAPWPEDWQDDVPF